MRKITVIGLGLGIGALVVVGVFAQQPNFSAEVERYVGEQRAKLTLTGSAIRKKLFFQVYAIASYVDKGAKVKSAEELVAADCPKQLHLVMLRTVSGSDMAEAFVSITRQNHPAPAFDDEVKQFADMLRSRTASTGDHYYLTHIPKVGLEVKHVTKETIVIRNPRFSQVVWEIYFGRNNVSEDVKRGLLSALK
jgi:hypothetical protein